MTKNVTCQDGYALKSDMFEVLFSEVFFEKQLFVNHFLFTAPLKLIKQYFSRVWNCWPSVSHLN